MVARPVPWLELILGSALALWLTLTVLIEAGVPPLHAILWIIDVAIAIVGTGIVVIGRERKFGTTVLIAAAIIAGVLLFTTTDLQEQYLPVCGDGACHQDECTRGCAQDCGPAQCGDGICTPAIERCDTSADCACAQGRACAPMREGTDVDLLGCIIAVCGDGHCDRPTESSATCCTDCGCVSGFSCRENACYLRTPSVTTSDYIIGDQIAATTLAANPLLMDAQGVPHPLAVVLIEADTAIARNATVTFALGNLAQTSIPIGDIPVGGEITAQWRFEPEDLRVTPLSVTTDTDVNLTIEIAYYDSQGVRHTRVNRHRMTILGRDRLDAYGHLAFFITPSDVTVPGTSARDIWQQIGARTYLDPARTSARIRFPAETLAQGTGNREELAVLLASAYQRAELDPALVETSIGTLVRVRDGRSTAILDPALLGQPYDDARWSGPGFAVDDIDQLWRARNATAPLSISSALIPGARLRVTTERTVTCVCSPECGPRVVSTGTVVNDGLVPSPICAVSTILQYSEPADERETCATISPGEERGFRHGWQGIGSCDPSTIRTLFDVRIDEE